MLQWDLEYLRYTVCCLGAEDVQHAFFSWNDQQSVV